jgi:hypothetical protein
MQIIIFWSQPENSDCDQKIHSISVFFLNFAYFWCKIEEKKRLLSEFSDHNQNFLIVIRIFW